MCENFVKLCFLCSGSCAHERLSPRTGLNTVCGEVCVLDLGHCELHTCLDCEGGAADLRLHSDRGACYADRHAAPGQMGPPMLDDGLSSPVRNASD